MVVAISFANELEEEVGKICKESTFYNLTAFTHLLDVSKKAGEMAELEGADVAICQIAGLLHDIGAVKFGRANHHRTGAKIAREILRRFSCPEDIIRAVQECILVHRGSIQKERRTKEAEIVATADSLSHFGRVDELLKVACNDFGKSPADAKKWVRAKLKRDLGKLMPGARDMAQGAYNAAIASIATK